jgi:predicted 3-demethylubiquinone-9 3-methyltransferase (glyoxalase superfamily)
MQKIIPHLWFDKNAEEAAKFYTSVFKKGKIGETTRYTEAGFEVHKMPAGTVLTVEFSIEGMDFMALNGGPIFTFTPAISFMVVCPTKEEVDELWNKLSVGGEALMPIDTYPFSERYGWTTDKYGLSWQIMYVPDKKREIYPSLLFISDSSQAEDAIKLYTSIFKNSKIGNLARYPAGMGPNKEGNIMYGEFWLEGQKFSAMDGSSGQHKFTFNEAVSLLVLCKDQKEIDYFWDKFEVKPGEGQCGWLKDKFGVSWQIVPEGMSEILNNSDKAKADRGMNSMLEMKKIDIAALKKAVDGK